jgi:hypothetical protein
VDGHLVRRGLSGTETLELSSSAELFVGELHVLNQDGRSQ